MVFLSYDFPQCIQVYITCQANRFVYVSTLYVNRLVALNDTTKSVFYARGKYFRSYFSIYVCQRYGFLILDQSFVLIYFLINDLFKGAIRKS